MKLAISLACIGTLIAALSGCEMTSGDAASRSNTAHTLSDIRANIGCDASYQCKVIGVGERLTCGGPREYLIYSTKHTDEQDVEAVVSAITEQEKLNNKGKAPAVSCEPVMPIQTLCIAHTCQAVPL
ncbi:MULTISPECIES: hypothetical protein [Pseudoalteromonas]|uniref:DUF4156 domain-containing protein n=1 Tax=Pseudoalteromonas maricaloris TaxID=184924 RepID=A0A8I2KT03_9GAMM|nr:MULTISPECIES: hypothetical protein [Pseudoalteromonas]KID39667.1 hypothetical protein QT15_00390 [Pseudoalteromonas flavipulchra NCIMB 2033 = ATCC BAA-314]MBD0784306.1 hypothetical protein [Pseudoalteromonas flavipulchra]MBE0374888.1 hypothetical protein [Pseudoalteromonas flavipulchra NCIMB 2033 = ATCC BAA-314]NLR24037.1 hypothetical protein [Pseudoalteromonas maricaloris]ODB43538.1 hypothetical protein BB427_07595 [Pseudoalteromonas sp. BMB]